MPLKQDILPLLSGISELAANRGRRTRFCSGRAARGFNTDVYGITEAFARHGRHQLETVLILGRVRRPHPPWPPRPGSARARVCGRPLARACGGSGESAGRGDRPAAPYLDRLIQIDEALDAVISTLPNGAGVDVVIDADAIQTAALFDVAYALWPTAARGRADRR